MDIDALTDADRKQLAKDLAAELDTGRYGSRFVLSRRQLLTIAGGSAGVAGLTALGVDPATAQSAAGQVGTQSSPEDVFAYDLDVQGALQRDLDAGGQAIRNVGSVSTQELSLNPIYKNTIGFSASQTRASLATQGYSPSQLSAGESVIPFVTPANEPSHDHGYEINKTYYDTSDDELKISVTETESAGGNGEAFYGLFKLGTE